MHWFLRYPFVFNSPPAFHNYWAHFIVLFEGVSFEYTTKLKENIWEEKDRLNLYAIGINKKIKITQKRFRETFVPSQNYFVMNSQQL